MKARFSEYYSRRRKTDMMPIREKRARETVRQWTPRRIREK